MNPDGSLRKSREADWAMRAPTIIDPRVIAEQAAHIDADDAILHALPERREPSSAAGI